MALIELGLKNMVIHACPVEDLSRSLSELGDILSVTVKNSEPVRDQILRDAKIYAFLRCTETFRAVLQSIYDENEFGEEDREHELSDPESVIASLCVMEIIDEEQAAKFMNQLGAALFFSVDRDWLLERTEDLELFDKGLEEVSTYYAAMCKFLNDVSDKLELIDEGVENDVH